MDRRKFIKASAGIAFYSSIATVTPAQSCLTFSNLNLEELHSKRFYLKINGKPIIVYHAAANYSFANFDFERPVEIEITSIDEYFWDKGVDIQPWQHGIRPQRKGSKITFRMNKPSKLSITRPGDYFAGAEMIFLFANDPEAQIPDKKSSKVRYFKPGIYHEDIQVKSNETIYLSEGAVIFGSLNFWDVENASIQGRGIIIHDGAQNPNDDEGWQHKRNWHGITIHDSHNIRVSDITCIVRSRTWMIQIQGSRDLVFDNIKVIGGTQNNANQDGIDWLGCGDTKVLNSFFRCSDDIFAIYGNTGFYDDNVSTPGLDVRNILIEKCVLSTSISNVMRVGWKKKVFNSENIIMRDCDIIHMGQGSCFVPFALAEFWADPGGKGIHSNYLFENIRMESWYSLAQLRQPNSSDAALKNIQFRNIWALEHPPLVPSMTTGNISELTFENIKYGDKHVQSIQELALQQVLPSVEASLIETKGPIAIFTYNEGLITPGKKIKFNASSSRSKNKIVQYEWSFGDGTFATGAVVEHSYDDMQGSQLDGSGRFRVQLKIVDSKGKTDAIVRPILVAKGLKAADHSSTLKEMSRPGLKYRIYEGTHWNWPDLATAKPILKGVSIGLLPLDLPSENYCLVLEGFLRIPADGGYIFSGLARDGIFLQLSSKVILDNQSTKPQACNTPGNSVQCRQATIALKAGLHNILLIFKQGAGSVAMDLYWQGPTIFLSPIQPELLSHNK